jgi:hypothetical protein
MCAGRASGPASGRNKGEDAALLTAVLSASSLLPCSWIFPVAQANGLNYTSFRVVPFVSNTQILQAVVSRLVSGATWHRNVLAAALRRGPPWGHDAAAARCTSRANIA